MTLKVKKRHLAERLDGGIHEAYVNKGNTGTAITLNCDDGALQLVTLTGNATITLQGFISGKMSSITVFVLRDATTTRTLAWAATGGTIAWAGGATVAPAAVSGSVNVYTFFSANGGTNVWANVVGIGYA